MTDQYQQSNINAPRKTQVYNSTGLLTPQNLDLDSDLAIAETDTAGVLLRLPNADQIPSFPISIKAPNAGTTGFPVIVEAIPGQTIDGLATVSLTTDQDAITVKASGDSAGAGFYWQIVASTGGSSPAAGVSVDLLSTLPGDFTVDNVISFDSWASLLAALALLPESVASSAFQPSRIWAGDASDFGWFDSSVSGASIEGAQPNGTFGRATLPNHAVGIERVRSLKRLNVLYGVDPNAAGARFLPGGPGPSPDPSYLEVINCRFTTVSNGGPTSSGILMNGILELRGDTYFDVESINAPFDGGIGLLNVECYDRCVIVGGAFIGGGVVICDILDGSANVDIIQPGVIFDLQLGSAPGAIPGPMSSTFGNAGDIVFGGLIDLAGGAGELISGGANTPLPPGSGALAIIPPFSGPVVGATITRPGYIRGIGVSVDNPTGTLGTFDIEVYIGGILAFTETGFDTITSGFQYYDTGFGRVGPTVPTFGGSVQLVVVPTGGPVPPIVTVNAFVRFV